MEKRILVADDSLTIQKVVELTFADSDYRLTCVSNGRLALEKIREEPPDLILADVVMPEKNGYEVCEEVKKNPETARIPVVLLAGTFEPFDRERARQLGCDAIVSKPFDSRELYRKVDSLVGSRSVAPDAGAPEPVAARRPTAPAVPSSAAPSAASAFPSAPPSAFDAGFVEEDFTGSIRTLRAGRGEPLANLYGPEDVESALAAFREVEPPARATDWRSAARPSEPPAARPTTDSMARQLDEGGDEAAEPEAPRFSADDGRTQRIDVSEFRPPRPAARGESTMEIQRDDSKAPDEGGAGVIEFVEPLPPLPLDAAAPEIAPRGEPASSAEPASFAAGGGTAPARELTESEIDRLAEKLAAKVVEKLSDRVVREVAWEVVPETAELVVRERLRELESGIE